MHVLSVYKVRFDEFELVFQVAENLAQLMYSVMMTGYMFKNAQYRLELQQSLEQVALPEVQEKKVLILVGVATFYGETRIFYFTPSVARRSVN